MASAAKTLLKEVGKPHNAHTIDIAGLRTLKKWLAEDEAERAKIIGELAQHLDGIRTSAAWRTFKDSAWNIARAFNDMIAIARVLDQLLRPRLPLDEATLLLLVRFCSVRDDFSVLRLVAQLEHYGKTNPISTKLRTAMEELPKLHTRTKNLEARVGWLTSPLQPERAAAEAAKANKPKRKR